MERTKCEVYSRKWTKNKNHLLHRFIWEEHNGPIQTGMCIHHIDGNKSNNDIKNLKCMSYSEHNKIHSHVAWNKGIPISEDIKNKIHKKRNSTIMSRWEEWSKLKDTGMTYIQIGEKVGRCREQVSTGVRKFKATNGNLC